MTVSSTTSRADANGNGVTTAFPASFRILDQTHITVLRTQIPTGVVTTLALTTDYTVSGVGGSSFTVTCLVAPTADQRLSILRNVPFTQLTDYVEGDPFPAATHEDALDKLTMQVQQLDEVQDRALTLAPNSTGISVELPEAEASALIGWNADADALVNYTSATTTPVTAFAETLLDDTTAAEARTTLGLGTAATGDVGTEVAAAGANPDITSLTALASINGGQLAGLRNPLINGAFFVNQRQAASNADDTYAHDGWYVLTQTGAIAVTTLTDVEDGTPRMARLTQSQASAQRVGYAQIIEGKDCKHLRGKQVTFRFGRVRQSTSANIRVAVLEWTGTEDTVTSDVVNDWTSSTYTAGNFFLASNLTVSSVDQQALTANTLADGDAVTVTLGSSFNNLIVFVWTEATVAQNVTLDLGKAQLEIGAVATTFERRPYEMERGLCLRRCRKSYADGVAPGTAYTPISSDDNVSSSTGVSAGGLVCATQDFDVEMAAAPTVSYWDHSGNASKVSYFLNASTWTANVSPTTLQASTRRIIVGYQTGAANNAGTSFGYLATAEL